VDIIHDCRIPSSFDEGLSSSRDRLVVTKVREFVKPLPLVVLVLSSQLDQGRKVKELVLVPGYINWTAQTSSATLSTKTGQLYLGVR